jgi:hypothetical protein
MGVDQRLSLAEFSRSYIRSRRMISTEPAGLTGKSSEISDFPISENNFALQILRGMWKGDDVDLPADPFQTVARMRGEP